MTTKQPIQGELFGQPRQPKGQFGKPRKHSDEAESVMVAAYLDGESARSIASRLGCPAADVYNALKRRGVTQRNRPLVSDDERKRILDLYNDGWSRKEIAAAVGWSVGPVEEVIHASSSPRQGYRRYALDERFFAGPPSEERDYLLGLLATDGCVTDRGEVRLVVQARDEALLGRVRDVLGSTRPLARGAFALKGRLHPRVELNIDCQRMAADLACFGIVPRKTHTLRVLGGVETSPHFWRGVIDGDGCIHLQKTRRSNTPVCVLGTASFSFVEQFQRFVAANVGPGRRSIRTQQPTEPHHSPHYKYALNGYAAASLCRLLYDGCTIAMSRKQALAEEVMRWAESDAITIRQANRKGRPRRANGTFVPSTFTG